MRKTSKLFTAVIATTIFFAFFMSFQTASEALTPYSVTYSPNGGVGSIITDTVTPGTNYTVRQNPGYTRNGYVFNGWNAKADGTGTNYSAGQVIYLTGPITLYAKWTKPAMLTVTYYGVGQTIVDYVEYGSYYTIRSANGATKTGYVFSGWNEKPDGSGTFYQPGQVIYMTKSLDIYAYWKASPSPMLTVTYYPYGSSGQPIVVQVMPGQYHTVWPIDGYTKPGYIITGWNDKADGSGNSYKPGQVIFLTSSITLYGAWSAVPPLTVTYNPNSGIGLPIVDYVTYGSYYTIRSINTFTRTGYTYSGWIDGSGNIYQPGQVIYMTKSLTLYAYWKPTPAITVTYCPGSSGNPIVVQVIPGPNHTVWPVDGYTKPGYIMTGWNDKPDGSGKPYQPGQVIYLTSSITLYGVWTAVPPLTVTYHPNGGTGQPIVDYVTYGSYYTIRSTGFTRAGYTYNGWNDQPNGSGNRYQAGQVIYMTKSLTLYAQWGSIDIAITYSPNGGSGSNIFELVAFGSLHVIRQNPYMLTGYTFNNWNTKPDGTGTKYYPGQYIILSSGLTLYATWKK